MLLVRRFLLDRFLTMPPRQILADEAARSLHSLGQILPNGHVNDGVLLASVLGNRLVIRRSEFSEPSVVLLDIKNWHTDQRGRDLAKLPYRAFLDTWYWLALSSHLIVKVGCCQRCQISTRHMLDCYSMHVHHFTYKHRGFEVHHQEDLAVLCDFCHAAIHGKRPRDVIRLANQDLTAMLVRLVGKEKALASQRGTL